MRVSTDSIHFSGETQILHNNMDIVNPITHCNNSNCYNLTLEYLVSDEHLASLLSISESCYQEINFNCFASRFSNVAAWQDRNMKIHNFFSHHDKNVCQCGKTNSCFKIHESSSATCNCDAGAIVQHTDTIRITDKVQTKNA